MSSLVTVSCYSCVEAEACFTKEMSQIIVLSRNLQINASPTRSKLTGSKLSHADNHSSHDTV